MHLDLTLHVGDLLLIGGVIWAVYQRAIGTLRSIEGFMGESRLDRQALHQRLDSIDSRLRHYGASRAQKVAEERLSK